MDDPKTIPFSKLQQNTDPSKVALDATGENFEDVGVPSPEVVGEESVSGSNPAPDADADTLANAHAVGEQIHEDYECPKEVDIARDIDEAEDALEE